MKRLFHFVFIVVLISTFSVTASAQLYKTGIGGRLGAFTGPSVKHFLAEDRAVEGILSAGIGRGGGFILTGLYEFQRPFSDVDNLEWYFGGGAHMGFLYDGDVMYDGRAEGVFGIDLIVGVEYVFDEFPFSISLDWKPVINMVGPTRLWGDIAAITVRYTIR